MRVLFVASPKMETKIDWANLSPGVDIKFIGGIPGIKRFMDLNGGSNSFDKCIVLPERFLIGIKDEEERHSAYLKMLDELKSMVQNDFSAQATLVLCVNAADGLDIAERLAEILNPNVVIIAPPSTSSPTLQKLAKLDLLTLSKTYKNFDYVSVINRAGEDAISRETAREEIDLSTLQKQYSSDDTTDTFGSSMTIGDEDTEKDQFVEMSNDKVDLGEESPFAGFDNSFNGAFSDDNSSEFDGWGGESSNPPFDFGGNGSNEDTEGTNSFGSMASKGMGEDESSQSGATSQEDEGEIKPVNYKPKEKKHLFGFGKPKNSPDKGAEETNAEKTGKPKFSLGKKTKEDNANDGTAVNKPTTKKSSPFGVKIEKEQSAPVQTQSRFKIDIDKPSVTNNETSDNFEEDNEASATFGYNDNTPFNDSKDTDTSNDVNDTWGLNDTSESFMDEPKDIKEESIDAGQFGFEEDMTPEEKYNSLIEEGEPNSAENLFMNEEEPKPKAQATPSSPEDLFNTAPPKISKGAGDGLKGVAATNSRQKANYKSIKKGTNVNQIDNTKNLQALLEPYIKRGGLFVFTGSANSGKTFVASNVANMLCNMGYRVCILDLDMDGKGMSYINRDTFRIVHSGNQMKNNTLQVLNSTGTDFMKWADVIREGMYIITSTLNSDVDIITDQIKTKDHSYDRLIKQLTLNFNFVIVDVDFLNLVRYYHPFINTADLILDVEEATQKGMTNFLLHMCNIPDEDIENLLYTRLVLTLNKYDGMKTLFGEKVSTTANMLEILDNTYERLSQSTSDYSFTDIPIASILNYNSAYEQFWFTKKYLTDTEEGRRIFTDLLFTALKST